MGFIKREKPCKGTGVAKGFGCEKPQLNRVYGLGVSCKCYSKWILESDKGREKLKKATLKVSKPRLEFEKASKEDFERKKLTSLLASLKTVCHEYIRTRDEGKSCISCGAPYKTDHEAGHFYKSETTSGLRYDEDNIHGQCIQCNRFKEGEESKYRIGLINRYGQEFVNKLDEKATKYKQSEFHWERDFLLEKRKYYQQKLKELKKPNY